jgi:hypothetical protein
MILVLTEGCIYYLFAGKPGYVVDMDTILKNEGELAEIKRLISNLGFIVWREDKSPGVRSFTTYIKKIPEIKNSLSIVLEYYLPNNLAKGQIKFGLLITDTRTEGWENLPLRTRIDELGDFFHNILVEKAGKENVKIKRVRVFGEW